jgi:hypothetical protein
MGIGLLLRTDQQLFRRLVPKLFEQQRLPDLNIATLCIYIIRGLKAWPAFETAFETIRSFCGVDKWAKSE